MYLQHIAEHNPCRKAHVQLEDKFASAFYNNPDVMAITTLAEGRYVEVNTAFEEISGYKRHEAIGRTASELNVWVDLEERSFTIGELYKKGYIRNNHEVRFSSKWGEIRSYLVSLEIIYIDGLPHILWVLKDISSLRKSEEALRQSEERFSKAFHLSPVMKTITRLHDGVIIDANLKFIETMGYTREEVIGRTYEDLGLFENYKRRDKLLKSLEKTGTITNYESSYRSANGQKRACLISACKIQIAEEEYILAHGIDITERKQMEYALEESQQRMRDIIDFLPDATFVIDEQGKVIAWNRAIEEMSGVTAESMLGKGEYQYALPFYGERRPIILDLLQTSNEEREKAYLNFRRKKGHLTVEAFCPEIGESGIFVQGKASLLYDSMGSTVGAIESIRDISPYKRILESLRQSEERFYKAFDSSPMAMAILNIEDGRFIEANQKCLDALGYSREEIIGHSIKELNIIMDAQHISQMQEDLRRKGEVNLDEHMLSTRSGQVITVLGSVVAVSMNGLNCALVSAQDVSEHKEIEANLARLDQLNLVGEMAASIGHEIRNPMTSIRGFLQMLSAKEEYAKDISFFELMIEELDRANAIISEFLGMAKDKRVELQPQYLDDTVKSIYPMIQADANYMGMDVELDLSKPPIPLIDASEIRQMILNMARNGLEAMSPGGVLTIGTMAQGREIILYIRDQGHGLDPNLIPRIGTPFVTTKDNGTGLGLAVCYSIAARHNARIDFETGLRGTTFYVRFPMPPEQGSLF